MKKTLLITWWAWYIWSHTVVELVNAWYKVVIVDNFSNSSNKSLDWIFQITWVKPDFYEIDLLNKIELKKVFEKYNFDWVLHFAWLKAVWESTIKPLEYFDNNITWSLRLFELMQEFEVKNIIFSSSATVYKAKELTNEWYNELDLTWWTTNPYWTTKFLLENILLDLSKFLWFNVVNLRYFNPIWAHNSGLIWEDPNGIPNNLLPYIMKVATWELKSVWVFWDDYETIDWTWVRDYIDVVDLAFWHVKAYEFLEKNKTEKWFFEIFNLWTWVWVSVLEMIKNSEIASNVKINYEIKPRRAWDLAEVYCNPNKAKQILNWQAETKLIDSLKNSWKFYNKKI